MKENRISIIIHRPLEEVFSFTTNPQNTHLWIDSIQEEVSDIFPPNIGTIYKNRGEDTEWDYYKVIEYEQNKTFTLSDLDENYHVRYSYKDVGNSKTELEYFEWMNDGALENPFTQNVLVKLKNLIES